MVKQNFKIKIREKKKSRTRETCDVEEHKIQDNMTAQIFHKTSPIDACRVSD
jgi:hypothetical protein